jgi:CRISPR/Cas system CMR-associated protein Cmr5 small subunit
MQNLEQLRAAAALQDAKDLKRSAISKLPGLILNNGLLAAAAAFCGTDGGGDNKDHLKKAMTATAKHLKERKIAGPEVHDIESLIRDLSAKPPITLQRATHEALAFLSFLKRFATND